MKRFAVYVQTFRSVVNLEQNTTEKTPVGMMEPPRAGFVTKEDFEEMAKEARKTFGLLPNQQPLFRELPPVIHIIFEDRKALCGRDYRSRYFNAEHSKFANCKNCLKKEKKQNEEIGIPTNS